MISQKLLSRIEEIDSLYEQGKIDGLGAFTLRLYASYEEAGMTYDSMKDYLIGLLDLK